MTATTPPALPADLTAGLRRLKLATIRQLAPELLLTAKTQRWAPEEVLRTLIEAEVAARDASNERARLKAAGFPVIKTIEEFDLPASSIPAPTWAYLTSLEWIGAKENLAMIGPAGTGKSHTLIALGHAAVTAGLKVKYLTAADLVENLYRALADNTVGKSIEALLRHDASSRQRTNVEPSGSRRTGRSRTGAGSSPNTPPPSASWTGSCTTPPPWSPAASPTACARPEPGQEDAQPRAEQTARGGDFHLATSGDLSLAVDRCRGTAECVAQGDLRAGRGRHCHRSYRLTAVRAQHRRQPARVPQRARRVRTTRLPHRGPGLDLSLIHI